MLENYGTIFNIISLRVYSHQFLFYKYLCLNKNPLLDGSLEELFAHKVARTQGAFPIYSQSILKYVRIVNCYTTQQMGDFSFKHEQAGKQIHHIHKRKHFNCKEN